MYFVFKVSFFKRRCSAFANVLHSNTFYLINNDKVSKKQKTKICLLNSYSSMEKKYSEILEMKKNNFKRRQIVIFLRLKSIRFVISVCTSTLFSIELTADVSSSQLGRFCRGVPWFLKLKIVQTLFTKNGLYLL